MPGGVLGDFDLALLNDPNFKEDAVREEIVTPFLKELGYRAGGRNSINRSTALEHPFVQIGSKSRPINIFPDYLLTVEGRAAWVLDAKGPNENIHTGKNVEQVYSYAIHPDVRVDIYGLCNGKELVIFDIRQKPPILQIAITKINESWDQVLEVLAPNALQQVPDPKLPRPSRPKQLDYAELIPPEEIYDLKKQSAKRHFGAHPYFTKQVWNVVQTYIESFTQRGDTVLDPFGGSGVTNIEALLLGRKSIYVDINPLAVFLTNTLVEPVNSNDLVSAFEQIDSEFKKNAPTSTTEIKTALENYDYPKNVRLPKDADVDYVHELFSVKQLAQLAFLKHLIIRHSKDAVRRTLLLMFSGLLNKINLTYHASAGRSEGRGDSGPFRYYRYRMAPEPADLDIPKYFRLRLKAVKRAKDEIASLLPKGALKNWRATQGTATDLKEIKDNTIDYIYTDPPYGSKIQYLDLSIMWNAWLDLPVSDADYELEAIEGGKLEKSQTQYGELLEKSIREMYRVLKFNRWMSFVFAHKDPAYWHLIIEAAEKVGFEYVSAVKQSNNKLTYKKNQNPFTVLSGQLIMNFRKVKSPKSILKIDLGGDITGIIYETIEGVIASRNGATYDEIVSELIMKGLEFGFLDVLRQQFPNLSPILDSEYTFDSDSEKYQIKKAEKFKAAIDVRIRLRYYLLSYMRRKSIQKKDPHFNDIILDIMPLLKNGVTPKEQTILDSLSEIAERTSSDRWRLREEPQLSLL